MLPTLLAFLNFARKHWRLVAEAALAAVLVLTGAYAYVMHETAGMWATRVELAQENRSLAVEQTKQAKVNYETLQTAIDDLAKNLEEKRRITEAAKARAEARARAAEETAREARKLAAERAQELERRLAGLDECDRCQESVRWLVEEVAR